MARQTAMPILLEAMAHSARFLKKGPAPKVTQAVLAVHLGWFWNQEGKSLCSAAMRARCADRPAQVAHRWRALGRTRSWQKGQVSARPSR